MWKFLDKLPYLGLFCRFIKDKNGSKFSQIEVVRLRGGDPPSPPKAVSLTAFSQFFFNPSLKPIVYLHNIVYNYTHLCIYTQTCVTSMTFNMFQIFDTRCRFTVCTFTHICVIFHQISFIFHLGYKILFHTIEFFTVSRWVAEIASWAMEWPIGLLNRLLPLLVCSCGKESGPLHLVPACLQGPKCLAVHKFV